MIIDSPYGFQPEKSTVMSILVFTPFIKDSFDVKDHVDVMFTDFS